MKKEDEMKNSEAKSNLPSTFPLVVKMMFNYDAESNAFSILRAMHRETVPARKRYHNSEVADLEDDMAKNMAVLPAHPNIVAMYYVFADRIPHLPGSFTFYPDALPARINPNGSGRNMSLFLIMKRFVSILIFRLNTYFFYYFVYKSKKGWELNPRLLVS